MLAAAATLTLIGGAGAAGIMSAGTATAATPSCGPSCLDLFSYEFGHHSDPGFVQDVFQQKQTTGTPIILFRTSDTDPAEDWIATFQGLVSDFYGAGMVSAAVELHYGSDITLLNPAGDAAFPDDPAFEAEYAPYGVASGLCAGVASTAFQGEGVTLEPCGVSANTVWIVDTGDSPATLAHGYVPLINGSDTNFSQPYVLTYPSDGYPTDMPRPQLQVDELTGFSGSFLYPTFGTVDDTQLWGSDFGVLK